MSTAVHMIIKALCKLRNNALLLCRAHIWCLSKLPSLCTNFSFSCTPCVFTAHSWLLQGTILFNSCNSGDKCNCQNNKCIFAVTLHLNKLPALVAFSRSVATLCALYAHSWLSQGTILVSSHDHVNSYNSGEKYNCQKNKSFLAVYSVVPGASWVYIVYWGRPILSLAN